MRIARLIFLSLTVCMLGASVGFAETIATKDYWVLTDGYRGEFTNSGEINLSYGPYGGYISEDVFDVDWPGTTGTKNQFFKYDGGKLLYYGARYVDNSGEWVYVPEADQEFLPAVLEVGAIYKPKWSRNEYQNGMYVGPGRDNYTITVRGPFTTTVPAGTYTTYELNLTNEWATHSGKGGITTYTYYVAKDIGWVKMIRDGITYELNSYARPPGSPLLSIATSGYTLSFSWTPAADATGYTLFYAPYPGLGYIGSIDMGTKTSGSFVLWDGAAFYVAVQAHNNYGSSGYSNIEHFAMSGNFSLLGATVTYLKFFESGNQIPPVAEREFATAFAKDSSEFICYQLGLSYPKRTERLDFTLTVRYYKSDGSVFGEFEAEHYVLSDWSASSHARGFGWSTPGNWPAGTYTLRLFDGQTEIAAGTFSIVDNAATWTNSLGQSFKLISAGIFTMGSPSGELGRDSDEGPQHQVTLTQPFYMQTTEVTQAQWEAVMGSNPSKFSGCPTCPVEYVSWNDVQTFITEMNKRGEGTYSLPTEAQWEYAARAGSTTAFYNGGITETGSGNDTNLDAIGWYTYNSGAKTHPVAQKAPNAWGLYDMSGNVWEHVHDWYLSYSSGAVTDPTGPSSGTHRVIRGGSWNSVAKTCRSANRDDYGPGSYYSSVGFRLLRQP